MKKYSLWATLFNRLFRPPSEKTEQLSTYKIKAVVLPQKENIMFDEFSGFTKTKIKIEQVYKGDLKNNMIIGICEPYYEGYYAGKKSIVVHEGYKPLDIGKTYTFLLNKDREYIKVIP